MMTRLFRRQFCVVSTEKRTYMPTDPVILITGIYPSKKKKIITHVQKNKLNVQGR